MKSFRKGGIFLLCHIYLSISWILIKIMPSSLRAMEMLLILLLHFLFPGESIQFVWIKLNKCFYNLSEKNNTFKFQYLLSWMNLVMNYFSGDFIVIRSKFPRIPSTLKPLSILKNKLFRIPKRTKCNWNLIFTLSVLIWRTRSKRT